MGESTSPKTVRREGSILAIIGAPKARVLPVPVSALAITSRPSSTGPIASAWIGVGLVISMAAMASCTTVPSSHSVNASTLGGSSTGRRGVMLGSALAVLFDASARPRPRPPPLLLCPFNLSPFGLSRNLGANRIGTRGLMGAFSPVDSVELARMSGIHLIWSLLSLLSPRTRGGSGPCAAPLIPSAPEWKLPLGTSTPCAPG